MTEDRYIIKGAPEVEGNFKLSYGEQLFENLKIGGNAIAQIHNGSGRTTTHAEILQKSVNLAESLRELGIKKGDVVSISSENRFEFTVSAIAIVYIGAFNTTLNVTYNKEELLHALNISKPKMIICSPLTVDNIIKTVENMPFVEKIMAFGNNKPNSSVLLYEDFIRKTVDIDTFKITAVDPAKHPLVILYSSGTTGLPKGVILTHLNMTTSHYHMRAQSGDHLNTDKCLLLIMPWFHAYGFVTHLTALNVHLKYVFMVRFEESEFLSAIQNYKVTVSYLVPPLMVFLAKHPLVSKYDLSSLKEIACGAAPLSKELQMAVMKRIGVENIIQAYGMTETTLAILHNSDGIVKPGSCGKVVPGIIAKVIDLETGESLGPNKSGELCFKGQMMMLGYIGDTKSTNQIFDSEGWLHTGDVGYYDEEEYFYIVDRLKELIKYKAFQVAPAELEALILQNPAVKDVGVVGVPDEEAGELPMAFVVLQPGVQVNEKNIIDFVASKVSSYKRLRGGVHFVNEIPKNPTGKILRRTLKNMMKTLPKSKL